MQRRGSHRPAPGPLAARGLLAPILAMLLLMLVADPVAATLGPPIKVQVLPPGPYTYPVQGQIYQGTLRITGAVNASVSDFSLTGLGGRSGAGVPTWQPVSFSIPPGTPTALTAMVPLDVTFSAIPDDPTDPVVFSFKYNGNVYTRQIRLTPRTTALGKGPAREDQTTLDPRTDLVPPPSVTAEARVEPPTAPPRAQPALGKGVSAEEAAGDAPRDGVINKDYHIRVTGRFFYYRSDGPAVGADGATVRVMDEDVDWDDELAAASTDANGYFDITFLYDQSEDPDIYLEFEAANGRVEVEETDILENNYIWDTGTIEDFTGTFIDFGSRRPKYASDYPALHILTIATRTWRWYYNRGYDTPSVDVQWPESDSNSWYTPFWEEMHINAGKQWREDTISHEYSHHWVDDFGDYDNDDYCNSPPRCDSSGDCGHCLWCQESGQDAWAEGFPDFAADFLTESLASDYGLASQFFRNAETVQPCQDGVVNQFDDAFQSEGQMAALLRDIIDSTQDDDPAYSQGIDELDLNFKDMMDLAHNYGPTTPAAFIATFKAAYPQLKTQFWATCENNGFNQTDTTDPGLVGNLGSPSHSIAVSSPDGTIQYTWTAATDDLSGIDGYSVSVTLNTPALPNTTKDIGNVTTFTTADLNPGAYYFNIRSVDRAGNWDNQYASFGPITIRDPYPADMRPGHYEPGWAYPIVPRTAADASFTSAPAPTVLFGNSTTTYFNIAFINGGELPTMDTWTNEFRRDGLFVALRSFNIVCGPGQVVAWWNNGPITVPGGRHNLSVWADSPEEHAEHIETDNRYSRQWVWSPLILNTSTLVTRGAPPDPIGGFTTVPLFVSSNCDGLTFSQTGGFYSCVAVWAVNNSDDYDARLDAHTSGATNGFSFLGAVTYGTSSRPAGCLDAMLVRFDNSGANTWDVGVTNGNDGTGQYNAIKEFSSSINFGTPIAVTLPANRYIQLRQFNVPSAQNFTVAADVDTSAGPIQIALYDNNFATGGLLSYAAYAKTDPSGHAQLTASTTTGGWFCVAVWRDPKDVPAVKAALAVDVIVQPYMTPADLLPTTPAGWAGPFVPRPAPDGTFNSVPFPTTLAGNSASTYLNVALINAGLNGSGNFYTRYFVDDVNVGTSFMGSISPNGLTTSNSSITYNVPGGRHTLTYRLDDNHTVTEISELNNFYGRQWVWSPLQLAVATPFTRNAPGDPTGGWDDVILGGLQPVSYNCDGLRTPVPVQAGRDGWWQGTATMPGAASDVDPRLHEMAGGTSAGFNVLRTMSGWSTGQSDFVLANFRATSPVRAFDVGVVNNGGTQSYTAETVASTYLGTNPAGVFTGFGLGPGHILKLHEVYLDPGPIAIGLFEDAGQVDWGLTIHEGGLPYHGKNSGLLNGVAWFNPAGDDEWLVVDIPVAGYYCIAVWKAGAADLPKDGHYRLQFVPAVTGAPGVTPLPKTTALASIHPNPFNPRTTIAFDLARESAVQLEVYNVRGERVRLLLSEVRPAGRHEAVWDGADDTRQRVASGVYIARLTADGAVLQRKMMLVK
jgi:hypothetical protein